MPTKDRYTLSTNWYCLKLTQSRQHADRCCSFLSAAITRRATASRLQTGSLSLELQFVAANSLVLAAFKTQQWPHVNTSKWGGKATPGRPFSTGTLVAFPFGIPVLLELNLFYSFFADPSAASRTDWQAACWRSQQKARKAARPDCACRKPAAPAHSLAGQPWAIEQASNCIWSSSWALSTWYLLTLRCIRTPPSPCTYRRTD